MKNKILFLFLSLSVICACSDDDDDAPKIPGYVKDFSGNYTGANIVASNGGQSIADASLTIGEDGFFKLDNVVNGIESYSFLPEVKKANGFTNFIHTDTVAGMGLEITGTLAEKNAGRAVEKNAVAKIDVKVKILSKEILGTWTYYSEMVTDDFGNTSEQRKTVDVDLKTASDSVSWLSQGFRKNPETGKFETYVKKENVSTDYAEEQVEGMIGLVTLFGVDSLELTFKNNGYIDLKGKMPMEKDSTKMYMNMKDATRYTYNSETKTLIFDALLPEAAVPVIGTKFLHIPFDCEFEPGKLEAELGYSYLKKFIPLIPKGAELEKLLGMVDGLVPENMQAILPIAKMMITNVAGVFTCDNLVKIDLSGILKPVQK